MPLPKLPQVPRPPEEAMAITIANFLAKGVGAAALVTMMGFDAKGRELLDQAAAVEDPATLIDPLEQNPVCWRHLQQFGREKLNAFAAEFIKQAKERKNRSAQK